jgi:4-oxalomesaconate hydratase
MNEPKAALVISAHAADFVWRCGGAIALHAEKGYEVTVVCLSFGERGESARLWKQPGMTLDRVKETRRAEAEKAAATLGVRDLICLDLGDSPCASARRTRTVWSTSSATCSRPSPSAIRNTIPTTPTTCTRRRWCSSAGWSRRPGATSRVRRCLARRSSTFSNRTRPSRWAGNPTSSSTSPDVWDKKRGAIECMEGQDHLWEFYTRVAQNRANHFQRNSGGQSGGRGAKYAEGFQSVFPRTVDEL